MSFNTINVPTLEQLGEVAAELGFRFPQADLVGHFRYSAGRLSRHGVACS